MTVCIVPNGEMSCRVLDPNRTKASAELRAIFIYTCTTIMFKVQID